MKGERKITSSEKKLFLVSAIAVAFVFAVGAWSQWVNAIPEVEIPTPKLPSPNAYDFYVKAIAAHVPANPPVDPIYDTKRIPEAQWKTYYPTAKKEAWLRQNAQSLKLLRQGFKYPCRVPPLPSIKTTRTPRHSKFRDMARLLTIESRAHSERANWKAATDSALDTLELGHDLARGGTLIDYLVGASINAIGRSEVWKILPHLNAGQSKAAARRLEKIVQSRIPFADVLREEKYHGQAQALEWMNSTNAGWLSGNDSPLESAAGLWASVTLTRRSMFDNYTKMMDALIAAAEKPYITKAQLPGPPGDIFSQMLAPVYSRSRWNYARDESGNALFLVALALRAYKLDRKTYPQTLRQLVPNYLQEIPADSFGGGEALRYKITGREYSLYSIGPDGIDNRGRAIEDVKFSKEKRRRFLVQPESKGDVVAGIN